MNPVDVTLGLLRPLLPALAGRLGVSTDVIERLTEGAVGGVAAGLVRQAEDREGRELVDALVEGHDRTLLDELGRHIQEHDGDEDAAAILGDRLGSVGAALAAHARVPEGVAAKALAVVAPVLLAVLRRDRASEGIAGPLEAARTALGRPGLAWLAPLGLAGAAPATPHARRTGGRSEDEGRRRRGLAVLFGALALAVGAAVAIGVSLRGDGEDDDRSAAATQAQPPSPQPPPAPATDTDAGTTGTDDGAGSGEPSTLAGVLEGAGGFANLVAALAASPETAAAVADAGAVTVFAPDDTALTAAVLDELQADPAALDATLRYHVVEGALAPADLAAAGTLTTLSGRTLEVTRKGGKTFVNGAAVSAGPSAGAITVYRVRKVLKPAATINEELDLAPITFEVGSAVITAEGRTVLDEAVAFLQKTPLRLLIEGHTDSDGEAADNLVLSRKRAVAVRDYLVARGIPRRLLTTKGFGEARPVASNDTDEGKARNRRIEFRVL